jgi:hypothetical protein
VSTVREQDVHHICIPHPPNAHALSTLHHLSGPCCLTSVFSATILHEVKVLELQMKGIPTLRCVLSNLTLSDDSESRLVTTSFPSWNVPDYHLAKHARFSAAFLALLSMNLWCIQCQCLTRKGDNSKRNTMLRSKEKELRDDTCQLPSLNRAVGKCHRRSRRCTLEHRGQLWHCTDNARL